jgi:hypothetical protein
VIGVFPTIESSIRLITCYLVEYAEDWETERSYIQGDKVTVSLERARELVLAQAAN